MGENTTMTITQDPQCIDTPELTEETLGRKAPKEVEEILNFKIKENTRAEIKRQGLRYIACPSIPEGKVKQSGNLDLPSDITACSDKETGEYLSLYGALSAYAEGVVAISNIDWVVADRVADFAENLEIIKLPKEFQKNEELRHGHIHKVEYIRKLRWEATQKETIFILAQGELRAYEKIVSLLSREITRRANTFNNDNLNPDRRFK